MVNTTTDHLFATWFDPFPFWEGAENIVRPSQLHREKGGHHTSAFRLLNLPFAGRCTVRLAAPSDDNDAMNWLHDNMPGKTSRDVLLGDVELPDEVRQGLLQAANVGLYIQVYANRLEHSLDWGRWTTPQIISVQGEKVKPNEELTVAELSGRGVLQGLQMAFENPKSAEFMRSSIAIFIDGEGKPSWVAPDIYSLFLGTPIIGTGEGKQRWEEPSTRGRNARGAGNRLMSPDAGTTIFTSSSPYRLGGMRAFNRDAITFDESIRIVCRHAQHAPVPTKIWSLAIMSTE